jgi:hypothetical protein
MSAFNIVKFRVKPGCEQQLIDASRDRMITILDRFRETLEDLGDGKGVTDPVSGEAVLEA